MARGTFEATTIVGTFSWKSVRKTLPKKYV
jgi:hypothetical protein